MANPAMNPTSKPSARPQWLPPANELFDTVKGLPAKAYQMVMERINKIDLFDETKSDLQKTSPWYQLGGIYYLAWMCVIASGIFLVMFYIPTTSQAFDSIWHIREQIFMGDIVRGIHKYGGDAMIIAATMRIYRMWFAAEYKNKGELTFLIALLLLLMAMYSGLTGYLLIWNQRAFWATKVFATFPTYLDITPGFWHWPFEQVGPEDPNFRTWWLPNAIGAVTKVIGDITHQGQTTSQILMGGSSIGQATMTRFFSLHFALSLITLTVTELYFYQNRLKRINLKWPAIVAVLLMLLTTAIIFPAETGSRANPEVTPLPILSDWYFLALYQMLKYMDPYWATIWTVGIPVMVLVLMFLDWGPERNPWKRPIFTMAAIMGFIEFIVFSALIIANMANIETDPPYWYASMTLFLAIGQFWHWSIYKQSLPMLAWVGGHLIFSAWYLYFWHIRTYDTLFPFLCGTFEGNPTNLIWNLLWLGFTLFQLVTYLVLWMSHKTRPAAA